MSDPAGSATRLPMCPMSVSTLDPSSLSCTSRYGGVLSEHIELTMPTIGPQIFHRNAISRTRAGIWSRMQGVCWWALSKVMMLHRQVATISINEGCGSYVDLSPVCGTPHTLLGLRLSRQLSTTMRYDHQSTILSHLVVYS